MDALYVTTIDFNPNAVLSDSVFDETPGLIAVIDKTVNEPMPHVITNVHSIMLYWRTVVQFQSTPRDTMASGFRLLAYPESMYCIPNS